MKKYPPIQAGATLGVVGLGSPLSPERYALGKRTVERLGYSLRAPLSPSEFYGKYDHGFANGSPEQRRDALQELVADPEVRAIITARGGYGALDVLPLLDIDLIQANPKPIVGISDSTALLIQGDARFNFSMIHGPVIGASFADADRLPEAKRSVERLFALLSDSSDRYSAKLHSIRGGSGEGKLLAGNLSMLTSVLGTPWDVEYRGAILVLEDVGEAPFQVHRNLLQLALAGKLKELQGLVVGRFSKCESAHGPDVEQVFELAVNSFLSDYNYPIAKGLLFGHWGENHAIPLGCRATLADGQLTIVESPLIA